MKKEKRKGTMKKGETGKRERERENQVSNRVTGEHLSADQQAAHIHEHVWS